MKTEMHEDLGAQMVHCLTEHIDAGQYSEASRAVLRECMPQVDNAVELMCPVSFVKGRNGVYCGYGVEDALADMDVLIVIATPEHSVVAAAVEWPEANLEALKELKEGEPEGNLLGGILRVVKDFKASANKEDERFGLALVAGVSALLDLKGKKEATDKRRKEIRAAGLVPVIFALVGKTRLGRVSGALLTLALPRLNEAAALEAVDATRQ
jgi:hypothetical protein